MSQRWYAELDRDVRGPLTTAKLKQLVEASAIKSNTRLRLGEKGKWVAASKVKGLGFSPDERKRKQLRELNDREDAIRKRRLVTPLSLVLTIIAMVCVLALMFKIQMNQIEARVKEESEERKPIMDTTSTIEAIAWRIKFNAERNGGELPTDLSGSRFDGTDAWGQPLAIRSKGSPASAYKIASAGPDGLFDTSDDIAIGFNKDHVQTERINTQGMYEFTAEMDALMAPLEEAGIVEEEPSGRFTYSNGVLQILLDRDMALIIAQCKSKSEIDRLVLALGNHDERALDHIEMIDTRGKKPVPGGRFNEQQWAEVQDIAGRITRKQMSPIYDSVMKDAGLAPDEP